MSRISQLIAELCPQGVEFIAAGQIAEIGTGSSDRKDAVEEGGFPFFVRSKTVMRHSTYEYDETAIIIPGEGGVGDIFHFVSGKYALHQRAYRVKLTSDKLDPKFAFYYFQAKFKRFIEKVAVSATVKSIRKPMLTRFPIPVPPLEIQREIVQVLDAFSGLEQNLVTELELRKKQFEEYRERLFSQLGSEGVEYHSLGDVVRIRNGQDWKTQGKGNIPVYGSGGRMAQTVATASTSGPTVLLPRKGSLAVQYVDEPIWNVDTVFTTECNPMILDTRFFFHAMQTINLSKISTSATRPSLTQSALKKLQLAIPPMEIQREIVRVLDVFTALIESIEQEIDLRHKQSTYYREKLLTFSKRNRDTN